VDKKIEELASNIEVVNYLLAFIEKIKGYKEAKFWIENRDRTIDIYNNYLIEVSKQIEQNK